MPVWKRYVIFEPDDFQKIVEDIEPRWLMPRIGEQPRGRKHPCEALLFSTIGCLCTGMSELAMEGVTGIPASLINIDFERNLKFLDEYPELYLMNDEEKKLCVGAAQSDSNIMYYVDGCDFSLQIAKEGWMYKTHKENIPKKRAIRVQILIDSNWGFFRGMEVAPAGLYNDQAMLHNSKWNAPDKLTKHNEYVGADSIYASTEYISVMKPFDKKILIQHPEYKSWNKTINQDRSLVERNFAIFKETFRIFDQPWRRHRHLFSIALRVCLKLMNKYWRLPQNMPPGLKRRYNK